MCVGAGPASVPWAWRGRRGHQSSRTRQPAAWRWGHKPRSTLLLALEVREPEGGGTQMWFPEASLGPEQWQESWRAQAVDPLTQKAECAPAAFPCSGAWTTGRRERTLADVAL